MTMPSSSGRRAFRGRRKGVKDLPKEPKEGEAESGAGPSAVKLLVLDCDGVLTGGSVLYGPGGEVFREFSVHDEYGIQCLGNVGVEVAILSEKTSAAPANARTEVKLVVDHLCDAAGGSGAVREVAELILKSRNAWPPIVADIEAEG